MRRCLMLFCLVALLFFVATASLWRPSGARAAMPGGLTPGTAAGPAAARADLPADIAAWLVLMPELATALAALKAGQVLDTDPITGVTVSVAQTPLNIGGRQLLVLVHEGQSFRRLYGYDRQSGMLIYYLSSSQEGVSQFGTEVQLTGVSGK